MENLKSEILNPKCNVFSVGEKRQLQIANCESRIASCETTCLRVASKGRYRYYESKIDNRQLKIQLNHGDPADDQARIEEIVTDVLNQQQKEAQGTGQQALVPDA